MNQNTAAEKRDTKTTQTVKEQLAKLASEGCRHCGGRGYTGINIETDKYIICRCSKRKLSKGDEAAPSGALAEQWIDAAKGRITQNKAHLDRLHEEIDRLKSQEQEGLDAVAVADEMDDEEQAVHDEAEFEQLRLKKMFDVGEAYATSAANLTDKANDLRARAETMLKESNRLSNTATERAREAARAFDGARQEQKRLDQSILQQASRLASERSARVHKITKRLRETQAKMEKLTARAGKVQEQLDSDAEIVSKR